jgi:type VI protein secretion system component VasF
MNETKTEFEKRTRDALLASVDNLDGTARSRLTQARHVALSRSERGSSWLAWPQLAPAGAMAVAVLALLLYVRQADVQRNVNQDATSTLSDIDLLADSDAYDISQEGDFEFMEWAAAVGDSDPADI